MISTHCDLDCVGTLKYGQDNGLINVFDAKAMVSFFGCCSFIRVTSLERLRIAEFSGE